MKNLFGLLLLKKQPNSSLGELGVYPSFQCEAKLMEFKDLTVSMGVVR